jgi:hypothetical protein
MYTYVKADRNAPEAFFIETWYDRSCRSWVSQLKDRNLEQIGGCIHSGTKEGAKLVHTQLINSCSHGLPYVIEWFRK